MLNILKDFFRLLYPSFCVCCNTKLLFQEDIICTFCRHDLPLINHSNYKKNNIISLFYGSVSLEKATSFLFFRKIGKTRKLIHALKYKGNQNIGVLIGNWFGAILKESNQFNHIDYIIPLPLHKKRLQQRGYNQLTKFGNCLSTILKTPYKENILTRVSDRKTQTFKKRLERFSNTETMFKLNNLTIFKNKHILLIDDVITTGATLKSCCKELLKTENIKISIVTMAFTE